MKSKLFTYIPAIDKYFLSWKAKYLQPKNKYNVQANKSKNNHLAHE